MQEQGNVDDGAQTPPLARQALPTSDCTLQSDETQEDIELGSVYEIDHTKLPLRTPVQLRSTRVVIVSEKTEVNVSVRFPSIQSLQSYFSDTIREMYPELDERFVMGTKLAEKVLYRKVPSQEFVEKKHSDEFWLVISNSNRGFGDVISNKAGTCLLEIKCDGMVRWGVRRQVKFIGKHVDNNPQPSSSFVRAEEKAKCEEHEEDGQEEEDDNEEAVTEETNETKQTGKRKRYSPRLVPKAKKAKLEIEKRRQINKNKTKNNCKQIVLKNPQIRWSAERYKLAEKNLLEVMKAKGAVHGNPILRPELRSEARKLIGDTGLLDHLLKHMAGKAAPGGTERFRRRHNAEGAMEYWLESADLVNIRSEAGVQDPYWTPPPGWELGDCLTQDPICAKELRQLKEKTKKLERDVEEMVSKKQMEEEIAKLRREMEEVFSRNQQKESQAIVDLDMVPLESDLDSSLVKLEKYEEQLMAITKYVNRIEEEIGKLKSKVEQETRSGSALMESTGWCAEKEKKEVEEKDGGLAVQKKEGGTEGDGGGDQRKTNTTEKAAEEKAAKIQRLKSGFRICKPQGTFLWPNRNTLSSQVVVQVEDLLVVPTPPSVSSSTASAPSQLPYHHHPASPVKPLAERRAVKVTVSTVGNTNFSTTTTTTTTTTDESTTTLINLNDFPTTDPTDGFCRTPSSQQIVTTTTVMPPLLPSTAKMCYNQQQKGGGSSSKRVGTWLALATPTPAPDHDSTRG
ncbi:similar to SWITCH1 [Actinidia rufa]|uniref:Similar to SWITCH1 n=1 Tax=Actinidia rufa TaxID=165716 RepID=A0A7J0EDF6_9ERIC|nr:similar to SWITCH1 [Actinidia rufa]